MTNPPPTVVDRNGTPMQPGQYVIIREDPRPDAAIAPKPRAGVVVKINALLLSGNAYWVDVDGLLGVEGFPSTVLEVMPPQPTTP